MLSATNRMRRSSEFAATVQRGRRARRGCVVVHHLAQAHSQDGSARIGFVVSRAVGPSTTRHRVTRQLRHLMRAQLDTLPVDSATVVRALPEAATVSPSLLAADLTSAVRHAARGTR